MDPYIVLSLKWVVHEKSFITRGGAGSAVFVAALNDSSKVINGIRPNKKISVFRVRKF